MNNIQTKILETCPVCHSSDIYECITPYFWGLIKIRSITCTPCRAVFHFKRNNLKLVKTKDLNSPVWADYNNQVLTPLEWNRIAKGGMSDARQYEADKLYWLNELREGKVNFTFIHAPIPIILKHDEKIYCAIPDVHLKEPRAIRISHGGYAGPSIRIAKGISFHVGRFGSSSESHQEIRNIDKGILTITNQRLVFSGAMKTVSINLEKIIQIDPFSDGVSLHKEGREKTQYFIWSNINSPISSFNFDVSGRSYSEPFTGLIFEFIVQGLRKLIQ